MKIQPVKFQTSSGAVVHTRYRILAHSFEQTIIVCEHPYMLNGGQRVNAQLQPTMSSFIRYMCVSFNLDPQKLVMLLSYVPLEQVAYCGPGQLMVVCWQGWSNSLFGPEPIGVHWYHATPEQISQWVTRTAKV